MRIQTAAVPPFFKNAYLVSCEETNEAVLIDPGDEVDQMLRMVPAAGLTVTAIPLTHAHLDHISGVGKAKAALGVDVWLHRDDQFLYDGAVDHARMFGLSMSPPPKVDRYYAPGAVLIFGGYTIDVLHTPGHCPGGVCLAIGPAGSKDRELFVGDTLFAGSIGRTDLPGGDHQTLIRSIRDVLFAFPDDTIVHSGHGPATTIGRERATNPFLT